MLFPKANFPVSVMLGFLLTAILFFLGHFLYYGWHLDGLIGYSRSMPEIIQTVVFSFAYAYLYMRASFNWRTYPNSGFLPHVKLDAKGRPENPFLHRLGNSLIYSVLAFLIILMTLYLAGVVLSTLYVSILEGIRGAVPPPDSRSSGALAVEIGLAGLGMELVGKTEEQPRN